MAEIEFLDEVAIDDDAAASHGQPCDACGCPLEPQDKFCPACGTGHETNVSIVVATVVPQATIVDAEAVDASSQGGPTDAIGRPETRLTKQRFFRCDNCAAEIGTEGEQRSFVCPFCDSTYVSEFSPASSGRQEPEFVIGFALTPEQARAKFKTWISENSLFRPGDLKSATIEDKLKGVYLPFWSFSMLAESRWNANIGEYWYRTETYVTRDSKGNGHENPSCARNGMVAVKWAPPPVLQRVPGLRQQGAGARSSGTHQTVQLAGPETLRTHVSGRLDVRGILGCSQ